MPNQRVSDKIKGWTKIGARIGVILADPKLRAEITDLLKDRANTMSDAMSDRYETVVHRVEDARNALRGRRNWQSRATGFAIGLGVGAGIGVLLAPAAGSTTRQAIRGQAVKVKNRVAQSASTVIGRSAKTVA